MTIKPTKPIVKRAVQRALTIEEFTYLAKGLEIQQFHSLRQLGKTANFSLLFSASARVFAESLTELSPTEASRLVKLLNLTQLKQSLISKGKVKSHELRDTYFLDRFTLATFIRSEFHNSYPGLSQLAEKRRSEATHKGYVRCVHGAVRRLPQMMLSGKHDRTGNKEMYNMFSIAINSPVQNFESVVASHFVIYRLWKWLQENELKSRIFNFVHDSFDMYIYKDEASEVVCKAVALAEEDRPEYEGITFSVSGTLGDYHGKGDLWKEGTSIKEYL